MRWLTPWWLALLAPAFLLAWAAWRSARWRPAARLPMLSLAMRGLPGSWVERLARARLALVISALGLMILSMARPQAGQSERRVTSRGIDIVAALDVSGSMRALDFKPNRLEAAKAVLQDFIAGRKGDRIALVAFAGEAFTLCPATVDTHALRDFTSRLRPGVVQQDGTAIGSGLATALQSLKDSDAEGRVIVLLTDGQNNAGLIQPLQAAEAARALGVRVYTIGVGTRGVAMVPVMDRFSGREVLRQAQVDIDEETLTRIAELTGGRYFRATDNEALAQIYGEIDRLEKREKEYVEYDNYDELAFWLILPALGLLLLDLLIAPSRLGAIP